MKYFRPPIACLAAAWLAAIGLTAVRADEIETSSIKFSDPANPGTLKLNVSTGDIRILGSDSAEVSIRTALKPANHGRRKDGLRVLSSSSSYSLVEKDNVITLSHDAGQWPSGGGDFDIAVPRNTHVVVSNSLGGDITVGGIGGDIEIKCLNGEVKLADVSGGALVETMNGEIQVAVRALAGDRPLSFTSMNGEVDLTLPNDAKANVQLRSHNGSILTDFDEQQLVTKTTALANQGRGPGPHLSDSAEIRAVVRDAMRVGIEAAREATRAAREAIREARAEAGYADDDHTPIPPVPPMPPMPALPPMTGGKIVSGMLNGGGPEIRISTMNGNVTLRKAK